MIKFDNLDCEITLLSIKEYESMKKHIPPTNNQWWLRSTGYDPYYAAIIQMDGFIDRYGHIVYDADVTARPALKSKTFTSDMVEKEVSAFGNRWIVCGEGFAISNAPIGYHRFDAKSNDYEKSEIRKLIEDWKRKFDEEPVFEKQQEEINSPVVDAMLVVRCKDCKHWREFNNRMICRAVCADPYEAWASEENDYCSLGERKEGGRK